MSKPSALPMFAVAAILISASTKADDQTGSALCVNEIMPANVDMFLDPSYNYGNWIEIYNSGTESVNLRGWYLGTSIEDNKGYPLGNRIRTVKPGACLVLWIGHKDDYCQAQIDFDLDVEGGMVVLSNPDGEIVDAVEYPATPARISWARTTDGSQEWGYTGFPTPGKTNNGSPFADEQLPAPEPDVQSCLFTDQFYFNIDIPEGATLLYTKDGSTPYKDATGVKESAGSHTVNETKVYRFRFYKDGWLPSPVVTRSYIKTSNDYQIPVLSVVSANDGLYSTEYGLWAKGPHGKDGNGQTDLCNWNREWDRAANVEFIDVDGTVLLSQEVEMCPSGRYSRAYEPHPFKIQAKKKFGQDNFFAIRIFNDKPYNKYKELKIRNGGNFSGPRFKDAAIHEIILRSGLDLDCQSYQPVQHYINGKFHGIINVREPSNKSYGYANYGIDEDDINCIKFDHKNGLNNGGFTLVNGTADAWNRWYELSQKAGSDDAYNEICRIVDIREFANYMAVELFMYNWDWPRNNVKAFRDESAGGRFRFILFDLDYCFGEGSSTPNKNVFQAFDDEEYRCAIVTLFHGMLGNDEFRKLFLDSFSIVASSVFEPNRCSSIVKELAARASREMAFNNESPQSDVNKLGKLTTSYRDTKFSELENWSYAGLSGKKAVGKNLSANIPGAVITINGLPVPTGEFKGKVFLPAQIDVQAPDGYVFAGWKDRFNKTVSASASYSLTSESQTLTATFKPLSESACPIRINEVSADNGIFMNALWKRSDCIELYNCTDKEYDAGGMYLSDNPEDPLKYRLPSGTRIPAAGLLTVWCDKQDGPTELHAPFKLSDSDVSMVILTSSDMAWADTLMYPAHGSLQSVGLYPDGGSQSFIMDYPSIGHSNRLSPTDTAIDKGWLAPVLPVRADDCDILDNGIQSPIYDTFGRLANSFRKGEIYIRNGKKLSVR